MIKTNRQHLTREQARDIQNKGINIWRREATRLGFANIGFSIGFFGDERSAYYHRVARRTEKVFSLATNAPDWARVCHADCMLAELAAVDTLLALYEAKHSS